MIAEPYALKHRELALVLVRLDHVAVRIVNTITAPCERLKNFA